MADVTSPTTWAVAYPKINAKLDEVSEDITPQLGGNLDMNSKNIQTVTPTEMAYVHGVTSDIQTQMNAKLNNVGEDTTPQLGGDLDGQGNYSLDNQSITNLASGGAGYWLSGTSAYLEVAYNAKYDMTTNDFSVELYIKPSNVTDTAKRLISKTDGTTGYEVVINEDDLQVAILDGANDVTLTDLATAVFTAEIWTYIFVEFDRDGNIQAYINGLPVGTPVACTATATIANASVMRFGTETGGTTNEFHGGFDTPKIHNKLYTAIEIEAFYSGASVDYKYLGASQVAVGAFPFAASVEGWVKTASNETSTFDWDTDHVVLAVTSAGTGTSTPYINNGNIDDVSSVVFGKTYSISFDYTVNSGTCKLNNITFGATAIAGFTETTLTGSGTFIYNLGVWNGVDDACRLNFNGTNEFNISIDDISFFQIGQVASYGSEGVGTYSWMDNSGNGLHGTISGAITTNLKIGDRRTAYYVTASTTPTMTDVVPAGWKINSISMDTDETLTEIDATLELDTGTLEILTDKTLDDLMFTWSVADHAITNTEAKDLVFKMTGNDGGAGAGTKIYVELEKVF